MNSDIKLNMYKYTLMEFTYIGCLWLVLLLLSHGDNQWLKLFVLVMCVGTAIRMFMLWRKLRNSALYTSNEGVFFKGLACDVLLKNNFLPFGIGAAVKVSYFEGSMQKRNIYIPKSALSHEHWQRMLSLRA
ncbi:hypothetical protein [Vibrio olivae]|uniref:Uncharacterized protein n=1 Tax=Vibrio olivae TaxID=1243002 RepID=A0ABV5HTN2_9VIBR